MRVYGCINLFLPVNYVDGDALTWMACVLYYTLTCDCYTVEGDAT